MPDPTTEAALGPAPRASAACPPEGPATTLRFGYHGSRLVPERIIRAAGLDPHGDGFELGVYDVTDPFRSLRAGEFDIIVAKFGLREPDLEESRPVAAEPRAAVMSAAHPLAGRASVSVEELAGYPAFDRPGLMPAYVWDQVVPPVTPAGRTIHRRHRVTTVPRMMELVATSHAVHISLGSLADIAPPGVTVVPIGDLPPAPVTLAWRRGRLSEPARRFVDAAERGTA
jgi:DNA-binding transcriptional LysR family regulator